MADIIGTDRGTYDVSTIEGCYHYLLRECHLPSHACAMVNKLYTMANIAEIGVQERQDWPKDLEDLVLNTRLHFREHMKWHVSHCPKASPYEDNETEPCDAEYKPYKVVLEDEGCPSCGATPAWTIECPGGIFAGQAWCGPEGKERAEEWVETLNCAYEQGKKAGNRARQTQKEEAMKEANRKQCADFTIMVGGEEWHCDAVYLQADHTPAWYECSTHRDGIAFRRIFGPKWLAGEGVVLPEIDYATS